jgi:transcriptional regulator with XRE-family HTH domain
MMAKKSPNPTDRFVGMRVRQRRLELGWSQERLAGAIGLTFQQVQKYEKGTNRIGASRMVQIANQLKTSPAYFFEGAASCNVTKPTDGTLCNEFLSSTDGVALARAFLKIAGHAKLRRQVVSIVETIANTR